MPSPHSRFVLFAVLATSLGRIGAQQPSRVERAGRQLTSIPRFTALGYLPGKSRSTATAVSSDGSIVVGFSETPDKEAFRWEDGVISGLGDLAGGDQSSAALGVSADGSVVVGSGTPAGPLFGGPTEAVCWENGVITSLGGFPGLPGQTHPFSSEAHGVSADGSVVVGWGASPLGGTEAFRWTSATGLVGLGDLSTTFGTTSYAMATSEDGNVIAGQGYSESGIEAFRWVQGEGMSGLGWLEGTPDFSSAFGISSDGSVVVGASRPISVDAAFRWSESTGMVPLAGPGIFQSKANGASADGSVIVGLAYDGETKAFLWDQAHGMRFLQDVLVDEFGLDLTGWSLTEALAITPDGLTIVGYGTNPDGLTEAWRAYLGGLTFLVTNTSDTGAGSLRQAIEDANASPGMDSIHFAIPGAGPHSIAPLSDLPTVSDPVVIDGFTQPGSSPNTHPFGHGTNAKLRIELDGAGLMLTGGNSTVRGLVINRVALFSDNNVIEGNFIGTNVAGIAGSSNGLGIHVESSHNRIGGMNPGARNLISFNNGSGVFVSETGHDNHILGNFIGTNGQGTAALGNQFSGIDLRGSNNEVRQNLISGNGRFLGSGIWIGLFGPGSGNVVQANRIGTDVSGTRPLGNNRAGITIEGDATANLIGGFSPGEGNLIAFNHDSFAQSGAGVALAPPPGTPTGNRIVGNSIHTNQGLGIDLAPVGVNPNDAADADGGPNEGQNYPVLTVVHASAGKVAVSGILESRPHTTYRVELFSSSDCDPSGHGEGQLFLGWLSITTGASGRAAFDTTCVIPGAPGRLPSLGFLSATATDAAGNTSEFSPCVAWGNQVMRAQ